MNAEPGRCRLRSGQGAEVSASRDPSGKMQHPLPGSHRTSGDKLRTQGGGGASAASAPLIAMAQGHRGLGPALPTEVQACDLILESRLRTLMLGACYNSKSLGRIPSSLGKIQESGSLDLPPSVRCLWSPLARLFSRNVRIRH